MKNVSHRLTALLLVILLTLGLLPGTALAADPITAYVTVAVRGALAQDKTGAPVAYVPVSLEGDSPHIDDLLLALHAQSCQEGAEGYATTESSYGGKMVTKLWGEETTYTGFYRNGSMTDLVDLEPVEDGDYVVAFLYRDTSGWSDTLGTFDTPAGTAMAGERYTATLKSAQGGAPLPDVPLYIGTSAGEADQSEAVGVTDERGCVTFAFPNPGEYYLLAKNAAQNLVPSLCVVEVAQGLPQSERAQVAQSDLDGLSLPAEVTQDLELSLTGESGKTILTWSSNAPEVLSADGRVTRGSEDRHVTLTVRATYGEGVALTRDFLVQVPAVTDTELVDRAKRSLLEGEPLEPAQWNRAGTEKQDENVLTLAQAIVAEAAPGVAVGLADTAGHTQIGADGAIVYGEEEITGTVTFSLALNQVQDTVQLQVVVPEGKRTKAEILTEIVSDLSFETIRSGNVDSGAVTSNLSLSTTGGGGYAQISWNSSDTNAVSKYGTVSRPDYGKADVPVTLTATVTWYDWYLYMGLQEAVGPTPAPQTKEIPITVSAYTQAEYSAAKDQVDEALAAVTAQSISYIGGGAADLSGVTYDLSLPYESGGGKISTVWTSEGHSALSVNTYRGNVARPGVGERDVTGTLRVTMSKAGYRAYKDFSVTVKAVTQDEVETERAALAGVKEALTFDVVKKDNTAPELVTDSLQMVYRGYYSAEGGETTWGTSNRGESGIEITWATSNDRVIKTYGTVTRPAAATEVTLTATLSSIRLKGFVDSETKNISVTVLGKDQTPAGRVRDQIAQRYSAQGVAGDGNSSWLCADLMAYAALNPTAAGLTDAQKQAMADEAIAAIAGEEPGAGTLAKQIIALRAMGFDARYLTTSDGRVVNGVAKLTALLKESQVTGSAYTLPYVLLALDQSEVYATADQRSALVEAALSLQLEGGGWGWGSTLDPDAVSPMVLALAPYYKTDARVKEAVDTALTLLKNAQGESGALDQTYGPAASTGLAMAAFAALGQDPARVTHTSGKSLEEGLLGYAVQDPAGFVPVGTSFATEQGFRGLVAAQGLAQTGEAYSIYDFSQLPMAPAQATWAQDCPVIFQVVPDSAAVVVKRDGIVQEPVWGNHYDLAASHVPYEYQVSADGYNTKTGSFTVTQEEAEGRQEKKFSVSLTTAPQPGQSTITVQLSVKVHDGAECGNKYTYRKNASAYTDLVKTSLTLTKGSTVFDALDAALTESGIDYQERSYGYVDAIGDLAETDHGPDSGWLYLVDGESPSVGCRDYALKRDAEIIWFYTDNYKEEKGSESWGGGSATPVLPEEPEKMTFSDVSEDDWYYSAVAFVWTRGLFRGNELGQFLPQGEMSRGMMATVLYRLAGEEKTTGESPFADVAEGAWYGPGVLWAARREIAQGRDAGFEPDAPVTRQELAAFLGRYARYLGLDTQADHGLEGFSDLEQAADWARDDLAWAVEQGLFTGKDGGRLDPAGTATRAEVAAVLERLVGLLEAVKA